MEQITIKRKGSYLYARAYLKLVVVLTVVYALSGALLAALAARLLDSAIAAAALFAMVLGLIVMMWLAYLSILWVFAWEARQSVEVGDSGIREMTRERETAFIPWAGVKEIEIAATVVAGASLRVKGNFSKISISNVDLVIREQMTARRMHTLMRDTSKMRDLLAEVRARAPHAEIRLSRLARRRAKKSATSGEGFSF